jgi:hypothetical protein
MDGHQAATARENREGSFSDQNGTASGDASTTVLFTF